MTEQTAREKYPHLINAMCKQAILSKGEAAMAIVSLKSGDLYGGGEAVWHYCGGKSTMTLVNDAFKYRRM